MAGKYQPLFVRLSELARAGHRHAEFGFGDIATLVGELPASAYESRQWWANSSHSHAQAWRDADWHVDTVDLERRQVRFARGKVGGSYRARGHRPLHDTAAAVLVEETDAAQLDVRITMEWQRAGHVTLDDAGDVVFPALPCQSGIYRLTLADAADQELPKVYIGESDDLRHRTYHYRRPGPTQQTNQRIHDELRAHLYCGGTVTLAVALHATIESRGEAETLPLGRKTARVLAEHAALALTYLDGDVVVINRDKGAE
ncbi:DUF7662 domain-containing protein [Qaidamihabitans albus]|uniref:DUF7662 domain-containing protein n=1 Tax=Qaidamihabitans albus TaxID=2795733 RepID=UPI0018F192BD|nr:hypothetical protein [Qaidamihabitans albus]